MTRISNSGPGPGSYELTLAESRTADDVADRAPTMTGTLPSAHDQPDDAGPGQGDEMSFRTPRIALDTAPAPTSISSRPEIRA